MRSLLIIGFGALLAGCGGPAPEGPGAAERPAEAGIERGIILGTRPLGTASPREGRSPQVLSAARGAGVAPGAEAVELTIRLDTGGRDVTLVQPGEAWLRPGQRVRLTPAGLARDDSGA